MSTLLTTPYFQRRPASVPPFEQAALAMAAQATGRQAQVAALEQTYAPITTELYGPATTSAAPAVPWGKIALVAGGAGLLVYLIRRRSS